ncbi:complex I subunit 1/NuoH family protein [Anaeromyxobacter paludicola]|uniref:NADH-quinone oxidoreductase subunit H n=1 Tax=Anaeromyxobacter paludicola TaxID=2918171 RepID=A0ABN6N1H9_9BACT|nr:complex I subunit 1 family protein [Anaeromyxobacter paludicola]BDG07031.1 NADH-quinone oxidoreductase subunit H 2 [Anaeromyxobacter paludicola]
MTRFFGMLVVVAAILVGLFCASWVFYLVGGLGAKAAVALGGPPEYGVAVANLVTLMLVGLMIGAALLTIGERKWSAMMQDRIGPNRIKVFGMSLGGIPFLLADALKMLTKENTEPGQRSRFLFELAPAIAFMPAFALFAVVPVGPEANVLGYRVSLQVASLDAGLLYIFGIASLAVYGTALAGWASNNKLALLGGVRASSQMIGYEVSLGLSLVGAMMAYQSLRLEDMVVGQGQLLWNFLPALGVFLNPVGMLVFFASAFAETKRAPFDLPEGESEIVGYFVEYPGMKFGMMMLSEFIEIVVLAAVVSTIFLGGWHPILFEGWLKEHLAPVPFAALCAATLLLKTLVLCWIQLAVRWTLPRFRYDQIQQLCWKMLLPTALANVFITAACVLFDPTLHLLAAVGIVEIIALAILTFVGTGATAPAPEREAAHAAAHAHPGH